MSINRVILDKINLTKTKNLGLKLKLAKLKKLIKLEILIKFNFG